MQASFYGFSLSALATRLEALGKARYRAQQIFQWRYQKGVGDFEEMTNLSKRFREELPRLLDMSLCPVVSDVVSEDGTRKWLFDVGHGQTVETVLIPSGDRRTLCVSSEVGCNMACKFCFTGKQKMQRRLSTSEIVAQFVSAQDLLGQERITNIVFMGMGEPLDNTDAVLEAVEILTSEWGYNLSRKKITISTSGLVDQFDRVADAGVRLAVSLNATSDEVRNFLMPVNRRFPLDILLEACRRFAKETNDKITFEYVLLDGITDKIEDARNLAKLTKSIPSKINIIPFNEHPGSGFKRPKELAIQRFQKELMNRGVHVLRRRTMGRDIFAACGQLRSEFEGHPRILTEELAEASEFGM